MFYLNSGFPHLKSCFASRIRFIQRSTMLTAERIMLLHVFRALFLIFYLHCWVSVFFSIINTTTAPIYLDHFIAFNGPTSLRTSRSLLSGRKCADVIGLYFLRGLQAIFWTVTLFKINSQTKMDSNFELILVMPPKFGNFSEFSKLPFRFTLQARLANSNWKSNQKLQNRS